MNRYGTQEEDLFYKKNGYFKHKRKVQPVEKKEAAQNTIEFNLMELIRKAREQKKVIVVEYQNLRYFPNEFENVVFKEHRYLWGIENFRLESPIQFINECDNEITRLQVEKADFHNRMITGF